MTAGDVLIDALLSSNHSQDNQGTNNASHAPTPTVETIPASNTTVDANSLPTINANTSSQSSSKQLNPESSSFTPLLGPPHMIPPPPNNVQLNPGYFQHLVPSQATFLHYADILSSGMAQHCPTDQPEFMTLGAALPQCLPFISHNEGLLKLNLFNLQSGSLNV